METLEYKLQRFDPGVVLLDQEHRVIAMNEVARKVLGSIRGDPFGMNVLQLHPEKSRDKLELLLRTRPGEGQCPVESPPPMTMMINIPDRVLLIKVTRMCAGDQMHGTVMMFYDVTDITTTDAPADPVPEKRPRQLVKIPVLLRNRVVLLALSDVVHMQANGHYTRIFTYEDEHFCNLSLTDLEARLNPDQFMRVHRSHIVNLERVLTVERENEQYRILLDTRDKVGVPTSRSRFAEVREYFGLA